MHRIERSEHGRMAGERPAEAGKPARDHMDDVGAEARQLLTQGLDHRSCQAVGPERSPLHDGPSRTHGRRRKRVLRLREEAHGLVRCRPSLVGGAKGEHPDGVLASQFARDRGQHPAEAVHGRKRGFRCADENSHARLGAGDRRKEPLQPRCVPAGDCQAQKVEIAARTERFP